MTEQYSSQLQGRRLSAAMTALGSSLSLTNVPGGLAAGTYRVRIDAEILGAEYSGSGTTFTSLARGLEGTTAAAHRAGVLVRHIFTGESIQQLLSVATADGATNLDGVRTIVVPDGALQVDGTTATLSTDHLHTPPQPAPRPVASRLYLYTTFS